MQSDLKTTIRVGSRKSELAVIQTKYVIECLKKQHPDKEFDIVTMTTLGDRVLDRPLPKIGEKSLFTRDLEDALLSNNVDFVVHSLKDLPTTLPKGLAIGAVFVREDPRDALVLKEKFKSHTLSTLPEGSVIGTSSLRRTAQLRSLYRHLTVTDVRGNLNTRLRKLDEEDGSYAALLLANAGLERMGWGHRVSEVLPCSQMLYAVGQGALAVECCSNNKDILSMLAPFNHPETYCRVLAERSFLKTLGGGCSAPVGVSTKLKEHEPYKLTITGAVWSLDGTTKLDQTLDETFDQIKKSKKHKLSPTDETDYKKLKIDDKNGETHSQDVNPIEVLNRKITEKAGNLNCADLENENLKSEEISVFCGLIPNPNVPFDVIVKCEEVGKRLANELISKGALEVMKVSQDLIRNTVNKSS